eukprot:2293109-Alexandrium_andersonii.AAC.1
MSADDVAARNQPAIRETAYSLHNDRRKKGEREEGGGRKPINGWPSPRCLNQWTAQGMPLTSRSHCVRTLCKTDRTGHGGNNQTMQGVTVATQHGPGATT